MIPYAEVGLKDFPQKKKKSTSITIQSELDPTRVNVFPIPDLLGTQKTIMKREIKRQIMQ